MTVALATGTGYAVAANASQATVTVEDDDVAPVIADTGPFTVDENGTAVVTLTATDTDTTAADLAWSIAGGADEAAFTLSADGVLAFAAVKDFEAPDDADRDGGYQVTVRVTDGANPVDATLTIRLTDVDEIAPVLSGASVDGASLTLTFDEGLDGNSVARRECVFRGGRWDCARGLRCLHQRQHGNADAGLGGRGRRDGHRELHGPDGRKRESASGCGGECGGRLQRPGRDERHPGEQHGADGSSHDCRHGSGRRYADGVGGRHRGCDDGLAERSLRLAVDRQ